MKTYYLWGLLTSYTLLQAQNTDYNSLLSMDLTVLGKQTFSTASRIEVPFDETIGTSYIIDQNTIKKRGYQSLKDVLEHIPGFVVLHRDLQYVAGARGLNANDNIKTTLMLNGYEISGVHEPDFLNGPISLDNVEKIEIIVGPSSFFEQANTLVATINIITQKGEGVSLSTTSGNDVKYRASAQAGKKWEEDVWVSASITAEERNGYDGFDQQSPTKLAALEGEEVIGQTGDNYHMTANAQYNQWTAQVQSLKNRYTFLYQPDKDLIEEINSATLKYTHKQEEAFEAFLLGRVVDKSQTQDPFSDYEQHSTLYKLELGTIYRYASHTIQAGIQYSYDDYKSFPSGELSLVTGHSNAYGIYLSDTWQMSEETQLVFGARADKSEAVLDEKWYPAGRVALIHKATPEWTTKLMANHVVRMPNPMAGRNEIWGSNNNHPDAASWAVHNPTAEKAETLTTYEWQNILYFDEKKGRASVTLYHQDLQDFISWGNPYTNIGDFKGFGLEGDLMYRQNSELEYWTNFSWVDSSFEPTVLTDAKTTHAKVDDENRMIGSPRFTANLGLSYQFTEAISLSPSLRYLTGQSAYSIEKDSFYEIDNIFYADVALWLKDAFDVEGLDLRARIKNITNNRDYTAGSWLQGEYKPRGVNGNFSVDYRF